MAQALRTVQSETRSYDERIRELVEANNVKGARVLLATALEMGDSGEDLSGWQRVLGPARVSQVGGETSPDPTPDFQWLEANAGSYRGQWVALLGGKLLAHRPTLQEVMADTANHPQRKWILLHRIY